MGLQEIFGNTRLSDIAQAFRGGFEGASGPVKEILDQIMEWGSHLTKNATAKWLPVVLGNHKCSIDCGAQAVVKCDSCGRYCCLAHVRIDYGANASCAVCVSGYGAASASEGAAGAADTSGDWAAIAKAYRTIGVPETATLDEVRTAYRKLVIQHHPDKARTEGSRKKREARLKRVNVAYKVLNDHLEKRAAA